MSLRFLTRDKTWLFLTRFSRLFAYGSLSVVLVFYLTGLGLTQAQTGLLLTLILAGDVGVSPATFHTRQGNVGMVIRNVTFFETDYFLVENAAARKLPLPRS